jgi:hypothetical protein
MRSLIVFIFAPLLVGCSSEPASGTAGRAQSKSPSLADLWTGKAAWVQDQSNIGWDFNMHFISILKPARELHAYYITSYLPPDKIWRMTVGRARSRDGLQWTNEGMVLDVGDLTNRSARAWDDRMTSFPGALKDGDVWYLVYEGAGHDFAAAPGDIGLATSSDGIHFQKHPNNPILRHNTNDWERINIGTPSLYEENGIWYLFYHGFDGRVCQIGVASGTSLTNLTRSAANPIVPTSDRISAWDTGTTGKRSSIMKEGGFYYMAFEGSTSQPYVQAKWSSGLARSTNLLTGWTKCPGNPVIPQTTSSFGYDGPELLRLNATWYLYTRSANTNTTTRFRLEVHN